MDKTDDNKTRGSELIADIDQSCLITKVTTLKR